MQFANLYGTVRYGSERRARDRPPQPRAGRAGRPPDGERLPRHRRRGSVLARDGRSATRSNALFVAHDDADYAARRGRGGDASRPRSAAGLDLIAGGARVERETSVAREAKSAVNDFLGGDGDFPPNPPVDEGTFGGGVGAAGAQRAHPLEPHGRRAGRRPGDDRRGCSATSAPDVGRAARRDAPAQGGHRHEPDAAADRRSGWAGSATVRGFEYGTRTGPGVLGRPARPGADRAAGSGRWRSWTPGQADRPADLFSSTALVGAGVGRLALRRRAAVRPEPPAHSRHRRQGAVRHRRPGGAMRRRRRGGWRSCAALGLAWLPRGRRQPAPEPRLDGALDRRGHRPAFARRPRPSGATAPPARDPGDVGRHGRRPRDLPVGHASPPGSYPDPASGAAGRQRAAVGGDRRCAGSRRRRCKGFQGDSGGCRWSARPTARCRGGSPPRRTPVTGNGADRR